MKFLQPLELVKQFNETAEEYEKEKGLTEAIEGLSFAISALKDAGIDVSLELNGWGGDQTFKMLNDEQGLRAGFTGFLRLGSQEHIISLITHDSAGPASTLHMSYYNNKFGVDKRTWDFDLLNDPEAYEKFQQKVVTLAARNKVIADHDVTEAFENSNQLLLKIPNRGLRGR